MILLLKKKVYSLNTKYLIFLLFFLFNNKMLQATKKAICFVVHEYLQDISQIDTVKKKYIDKVECTFYNNENIEAADWVQKYASSGVYFDFYSYKQDKLKIITKVEDLEYIYKLNFEKPINTANLNNKDIIHGAYYFLYAVPKNEKQAKKIARQKELKKFIISLIFFFILSIPLQIFYFFWNYKIVPRETKKKKKLLDPDLQRFMPKEE